MSNELAGMQALSKDWSMYLNSKNQEDLPLIFAMNGLKDILSNANIQEIVVEADAKYMVVLLNQNTEVILHYYPYQPNGIANSVQVWEASILSAREKPQTHFFVEEDLEFSVLNEFDWLKRL